MIYANFKAINQSCFFGVHGQKSYHQKKSVILSDFQFFGFDFYPYLTETLECAYENCDVMTHHGI